MTLRLKDDGYAWKTIYEGRKAVGRVCTHAEGGYLGIIGKLTVRAPTEEQAFNEVGARHLGFADAETLQDHNTEARTHIRARRQRAKYVASEMMRGNFEPLDRMLGLTAKRS